MQRGLRNSVRLAVRIGLAVCDQGLYAGTSFVTTLLLARWLLPDRFGAFALVTSVLMLIQNVVDGLVCEPFALFAAGRSPADLDVRLGRTLLLQIIAGAPQILVLAAAAGFCWAWDAPALAAAFGGLAAVAVPLCMRSLVRQCFYVQGRVGLAALVSAAHLLVSVALLAALRGAGLLGPATAFMALGAGAATATAAALWLWIRPRWRCDDPELALWRLACAHTAYGRWAVGERALLWLQTNLGYLLLPWLVGLQATGAFRAAGTLAMPAYMTLSAVAGLLLPSLARLRASGITAPWERALPAAWLLATAAYMLPLLLFGQAAGGLLFAGRYDSDLGGPVMPLLALGLLTYAASAAAELRLRAGLDVTRIVIARLVSTGVSLVAGLALTATMGLPGALLAAALTWLATVVALLVSPASRRRPAPATMPLPSG